MIRIALVGDIGSGKTYYARLFGYPVFNADLIEIGRAHVRTPVTEKSRMPSSA